MDEDTHYNKGTGVKYCLGGVGAKWYEVLIFFFALWFYFLVEDVVGSHVEDAVTFWAQVTRSSVGFSFLPSSFLAQAISNKSKIKT